MTDQGGVHEDHPFETPDEQRDPARRFRGRLAAPVTVITAGNGERSTGLGLVIVKIPAKVQIWCVRINSYAQAHVDMPMRAYVDMPICMRVLYVSVACA